MTQFTLRLDKKQQRPVVLLNDTLTELLDTGAVIPIWTDADEILEGGDKDGSGRSKKTI